MFKFCFSTTQLQPVGTDSSLRGLEHQANSHPDVYDRAADGVFSDLNSPEHKLDFLVGILKVQIKHSFNFFSLNV